MSENMLNHPADWYLDKIRRGEPFTLSKWGDTELMAVYGRATGKNCDGMQFSSEIAAEIKAVFQHAVRCSRDEYFLAVEPNWLTLPADHRCGVAVRAVYQEYGLHDMPLHDLNAFHKMVGEDRIHEAVQEFREHPLLVAAPVFYQNIKASLRWNHFVPTGGDCWGRRHQIYSELLDQLRPLRCPAVVLIAGSVTANWVINELYRTLGNDHWLIDWGSTLDPYCGRLSRTFHRADKHRDWTLRV